MLSEQYPAIINHISKAGHITVRQALQDHGITSLPRRICDLENRGFKFAREWAKHPVTGQRYVRYRFAEGSPTSFEEARTNPWKQMSPAT